MIPTKERVCEICKVVYYRKPTYPIKQWEKQKTCCGKHRSLLLKKMGVGFKKGHPTYSKKGQFKKGHLSWNKGVWGRQKWMNTSGLVRYRSGKNHPLWKGGVTTLQKKIRNLRLYREWRRSVFIRDKFTCQNKSCGQVGGRLETDHIEPMSFILKEEKITTVKQAKKCARLWDLSNGRTYCIPCHKKTDTYGMKAINYVKI